MFCIAQYYLQTVIERKTTLLFSVMSVSVLTGTGTDYPCHVVPDASLAVLSRPVNLSVVRSPFQFVQRTDSYSVYAFDVTVTWDDEHYYCELYPITDNCTMVVTICPIRLATCM